VHEGIENDLCTWVIHSRGVLNFNLYWHYIHIWLITATQVIYVCMYIYLYVCMHINFESQLYIYIYIYIYIHIYIYIYIKICTWLIHSRGVFKFNSRRAEFVSTLHKHMISKHANYTNTSTLNVLVYDIFTWVMHSRGVFKFSSKRAEFVSKEWITMHTRA
jgi:hypothetical protein